MEGDCGNCKCVGIIGDLSKRLDMLTGEVERLKCLVAGPIMGGASQATRVPERRTDGSSDGLVRDGGSWKVARRHSTRLALRKVDMGVPIKNRFDALEEREGNDERDGGGDDQMAEDRDGEREVLVIGDSRVRYMDRTFCSKNPSRRMRVCYPGAQVKDVRDRLEGVMRGSGEGATVIVQVGVNDVGKNNTEETMKAYRALIGSLAGSRKRGVVTSILPMVHASMEWYSRAIGLNTRVANICKELGVQFLDLWGEFWGRTEMFALDGLHLSKKGVELLSNRYEEALNRKQGN